MKKLILFAALIIGSVQGFAQTPPAAAPAGQQIVLGNTYNADDCSPAKFQSGGFAGDGLKAAVEKCEQDKYDRKMDTEYNSSVSTCNTKLNAFSEARRKANTSCRDAKLNGSDTESCATDVNSCQNVEDNDEVLDKYTQSLLMQSGSIDRYRDSIFEAGGDAAAKCPNFSYDDYQANKKKILDELESLRKESEEIQQIRDKAEAEYKKTVKEIQKSLKALPLQGKKSKDEEVAKIQQSLADNRAAEAKQMAEISKTEIDISDAVGKIADLEAKRITELSKIVDYRNKENCKASALSLRKRLLKRTGSKSVQTALRSKQSIKEQVEGDYKACYATLQANRREIDRSFDSQIDALKKRIEVAEKNIAAARELQEEARKAINADIAKLPEKEKEIESELEEKRKELLDEERAATEEFNKGLESAMRQLKAIAEKEAEQKRLLADLGHAPAPGAKKTTGDVSNELGDLTGVIDDAKSICGCDTDASEADTKYTAGNASRGAEYKLKEKFRKQCESMSKLAGKISDEESSDEADSGSSSGKSSKSGSADAPKK